MKYAIAVAALVALVSAQSLSDIPPSAQSCLLPVVTSDGCSDLTDFKCHCGKTDLITKTADCISKIPCADQVQAAKAITGLCASAGAPISIPNPTCAGSSAPASSAPTASPKPAGASSAPASYAASSKPAAPSSYAASSAPCSTSTVTVIVKSTGAPYPTGPKPTGPTGTAAPTYPAKTSSLPAQYTGAASSVEMPIALAGVVGIAALLF